MPCAPFFFHPSCQHPSFHLQENGYTTCIQVYYTCNSRTTHTCTCWVLFTSTYFTGKCSRHTHNKAVHTLHTEDRYSKQGEHSNKCTPTLHYNFPSKHLHIPPVLTWVNLSNMGWHVLVCCARCVSSSANTATGGATIHRRNVSSGGSHVG